MTTPQPLSLGSMCTGYGGLDLAVSTVLDVAPAWVADPDPGAAAILAHHMPDVANIGDITAVDWKDVVRVDILAAGYPCQPFSHSGKRKGTADVRHLWPHIARAVRHLRPGLLILENVAGHRSLGFDRVLGDLAALGFDAEWTSLRASDVGAAHERERVFVLAWPAADPPDFRHQRRGATWRWRLGPADGRDAAADTDRGALGALLNRTPHQPQADHDHHEPDASGRVLDWGPYTAAIHRWEELLGRPAPAPTEPGLNSQPRLTPAFTEWLMGLPTGWVTAVPGLTRNQQLTALGNGVVWQQGAAALAALLTRLTTDRPLSDGRAA
ncbi:DNA cytosine methyltransferase [Actinomadura sp. 7K534]|uniref:DNA cytosine methyltransferase n=1 Tax=Actinomadura sp. 7K534 TaxID=2530366 RepID=UPI001048FDAB|nr:DNA cytosine methyltransferase [Actinomadura sp. 7K534]TDB96364.1 DNA cytosine methyltransferase [Actinomadura sp. 7K534]